MLTITDIFGNTNLDNETAFLVVIGENLISYLSEKDTLDEKKIYRPNIKLMSKFFKQYEIEIKNFVSVSDILIYKNEIPKKILFINVDLVKFPMDYVSIELFNNGTIWQPIGTPGYKSMGLIYEKGNNKPKTSAIPLIPIELLLKIKNGPSSGLHAISEFKNLSNDIHGFYNLDKSRITDNPNDYFKLLTYEGKYLTKSNDKFALFDKNKLRSQNQIFKYTINGDLIINNSCLTNREDEVVFDECDESEETKWDIKNNNIISRKNNLCLTVDENDTSLKKCNKRDTRQQFTKENPNNKSNSINDFVWKNIKGKSVVLTYNDNPWYNNKDITKAYPGKTTKESELNNIFQYNKLKGISDSALGGMYGLVPEKKNIIIEKFEDNNNRDIICIIIAIIITILIVYFVYKKKNLFFKENSTY